MIPDFIDKTFTLPRGWEYDCSADYTVAIVMKGVASEQRSLQAEHGRTRIDVTIPRDRVADIPALRRWYRATRGKAVGFRVQDPSDYLSTEAGYAADVEATAIAATDQPLIETATVGVYQLTKRYAVGDESGDLTYDRPIYKPVSIIVANEVGAVQDDSKWDLDLNTGLLTPNGSFVGTPNTWGGSFEIPIRFDSDLPVRVADFRIDQVSFSLLELADAFD